MFERPILNFVSLPNFSTTPGTAYSRFVVVHAIGNPLATPYAFVTFTYTWSFPKMASRI